MTPIKDMEGIINTNNNNNVVVVCNDNETTKENIQQQQLKSTATNIMDKRSDDDDDNDNNNNTEATNRRYDGNNNNNTSNENHQTTPQPSQKQKPFVQLQTTGAVFNNNNNNNTSLMMSPNGYQLLDFVNDCFGNSPLFHMNRHNNKNNNNNHIKASSSNSYNNNISTMSRKQHTNNTNNITTTNTASVCATPDPSLRKKRSLLSSLSTTSYNNHHSTTTMTPKEKHGTHHNLHCPPTTPRHCIEWHECSIHKLQLPPQQQQKIMHWMDWSIKSSIHIQYPTPYHQSSIDSSSSLSLLNQLLLLSTTSKHDNVLCKSSNEINAKNNDRIRQQYQYYQQLAIQQLSTISTVTSPPLHADNNDDDTFVSASIIDFYSSLYYWQHPSIHPLPDAMFATTATTTKTSKDKSTDHLKMIPPTKKKKQQQQQQHMRAFTTASGTNTSKQHNGRNMNNITNESLIQTRCIEWQQAFQSIYWNWTNKIRLLNHQWWCTYNNNNNNTMKNNKDEMTLFYKQISETYFYILGTGHTILFRVGFVPQNNKNDNQHTITSTTTAHKEEDMKNMQQQNVLFVPEIILSSSSLALRKKLRTLGVQLHLLNEWDEYQQQHDIDTSPPTLFDEEWLLDDNTNVSGNNIHMTSPISSNNNNNNDTATTATSSPNVLSELIALRRQQMYGWRNIAGPEINVTIKNNKRTTITTTASNLGSEQPTKLQTQRNYKSTSVLKCVPPLLISNTNDCTTFFHLYQQCLGQINEIHDADDSDNYCIHPKNLSTDVPRIICRKIGPFQNATIKMDQITIEGDEEDHGEANNIKTNSNTSIHINGCFLPCAIRDLTCSIISIMTERNNTNMVPLSGENDDIEKCIDGGSHFVLNTSLYHGDEVTHRASSSTSTTSKIGQIGTSNSERFNGEWSIRNHHNNDNLTNLSIHAYCHANENMSVVVWDESRPTSLAIKLRNII